MLCPRATQRAAARAGAAGRDGSGCAGRGSAAELGRRRARVREGARRHRAPPPRSMRLLLLRAPRPPRGHAPATARTNMLQTPPAGPAPSSSSAACPGKRTRVSCPPLSLCCARVRVAPARRSSDTRRAQILPPRLALAEKLKAHFDEYGEILEVVSSGGRAACAACGLFFRWAQRMPRRHRGAPPQHTHTPTQHTHYTDRDARSHHQQAARLWLHHV